MQLLRNKTRTCDSVNRHLYVAGCNICKFRNWIKSKIRLTFLVIVIISVEDLSVTGIAIRVFPDDVWPRVFLVLQRAGQSEAESDRSTAERTRYTCERSVNSHFGVALPLGWRYVNQCSTLRCYKRTRDAKDGICSWAKEGREKERERSCIEWCVTCVEGRTAGHLMWNDRYPRPKSCRYQFDNTLNTSTLFAIVLLALRVRCLYVFTRWGIYLRKFSELRENTQR